MDLAVKIIVAGVACTVLSACADRNIAQKALGDDAIKVSSAPAMSGMAPGIYRIKGGNLKRGVEVSSVCPEDFKQQNALKALTTTIRPTNATIDDDNFAKNLTISIPNFGIGPADIGGSYSPQVEVDRAANYKTISINQSYTPTELADFMIANVARKCAKENLYGDLVFVGASAQGDAMYRVKIGGGSIHAAIWPFSGKVETSAEPPRFIGNDVLFGIKGERRQLPKLN